MAVAIIGGLITSTALTLGVVPVVYSLLDDPRNRSGSRRSIPPSWRPRRRRGRTPPERTRA